MPNLRTALVQLSDIHIKQESRSILNRIEAITNAVRAEAADSEALFLIISGDVAFSGHAEEYKLAHEFLSGLLTTFRQWVPHVNLLMIPGNHDCDFRAQSRVRDIVIDDIDGLLEEITSDRHEAASQCLSVQQAFFNFATPYLTETTGDRLHYTHRHSVGTDSRIRFECINTAWLSRKEEKQGQIRVPPSIPRRLADPAVQTADEFVVTLLHHPYAWFDPTNRRLTQPQLERNSDLILTGHEHVAENYYRTNPGSTTVQYVEGGVFHGDSTESSFNLINLDFGSEQQQIIRFKLRGATYLPVERTLPVALVRNKGSYGRRFSPNSTFASELTHPGRSFKHPRARDLRLRDLYIYPDLRQRPFDKLLAGQKANSNTIYSENVVSHLIKVKRALLIGPSESGKTALLRSAYVDLQENYYLHPLLLNSAVLDGYTDDALHRAVNHAVTEQYSAEVVDEYSQLAPEHKVLFIDDFQDFPYNGKAQTRLLKAAQARFGMVIVFADDLFRYEELSEVGHEDNPFLSFDHCEIKPFGFRLRHQLIHKWVLLGQEYRITTLDVFKEVESRENTVNNVFRGDLIPGYPLIVLLILQASEVDPNKPVSSGTYGYLNDFLIMRALAQISKQITDIGTLSAYLSHLAYAQFLKDDADFSRTEFDVISQRYLEEYALPLSSDQLLIDLVSAQILAQTPEHVSFRYRHYYYYFVARYFRDHIDGRRTSEETGILRKQLLEIADNIYFEPYVSILTFYLYFKKDEELIEHLLRNSKEIYSEYAPCRLEADVEFLNALYEKKPNRSLPEPKPDQNRESLLRNIDDVDPREGTDYILRPKKLKYTSDLKDYLKINIALKTMQVLGQVLKDSPGELRATLKADIAEECYSIGLRTLRAVFTIAEINLAEYREAIEELIKERRADDPEAKIAKDANQFLLWLSLGATLGVIRRISRAVGHIQLEKTYQEVMKRFGNMLSVELIDLSIKTEQFHHLKRPVIERMVHEKLQNNIFGYQVLQELIYSYFALFPSDRSERQRICSAVGITSEDPRFLDSRLKKLAPGAPPQKRNRRNSRRKK